MQRHIFNIATLSSTVIAAVLMVGYLAYILIKLPVPLKSGSDSSELNFGLGGGGLTFGYQDHHGLHASSITRWSFFGTPQLSTSIWHFESNNMHLSTSASSQTWDVYQLEFPIWVLLLPSLILPTLWIRRLRQFRQQPRGFEVEQTGETGLI